MERWSPTARSSRTIRWPQFRSTAGLFLSVPTDAISQLYLTGVGTRSFFDARTMYFYGFSEADMQRQIPVVHPVIDYANVVNRPIFGGELSYRANLTSLSREAISYNPITATGASMGFCLPTSADPTVQDAARTACCAASPATPRVCRAKPPGGVHSRIRSARSGRRSPGARRRQSRREVKPAVGVTNFLPAGDINAAG